MIQGLPDEELASAVKNPSGVIPGWLALATLQQRNTLRQSAPVAPPQGTVADNVVGQALRSAGFHPQGQEIPSQQQPQQPTQQPPQGAGIMSQQPQGMARGGIVRMADGGSTGSYADLLQQAGILAPLSTITPQQTTYDPGYKPDATDLQGAQAKVAPLYGKGPDYAATLADIDALRKQSEASSHVGVGQFLTNLVGGIMGSKGNATQGFGEALSNESTLERNLKQQNIANQQKLITDKASILGQQDERQQKIAGAAEHYQALNAQIADTQARAKLANDSGNADRVEAAQKTNADLAERRSQLLNNAMKSASENPLYANAIATQLEQQGNKAGAALYRDAANQYMKQKQAEADIVSSRQMALEQARAKDERSLQFGKLAQEHKYKMEESGMLNPDGSSTTTSSAGQAVGLDGKPMGVSPDYAATASSLGSHMQGLQGLDPNNKLDGPAVYHLLTNDVPFKGQGAVATNRAILNREADIMHANGITGEELAQIRSHYKANVKTVQTLSEKNQQLQMSEHRIDAQIPNMEDAIKRNSPTGYPSIDSGINYIKGFMGGTANIDRESAIVPITSEYGNFMGGGNKGATDASRAEAHKLLPSYSNLAQSRAATANLKKEMEAQSGAGGHAVTAAVERTKLSNILGAIRTNNVDYGVKSEGYGAAASGPKQGDKQTHNGSQYVFDGSVWKRQ